MVSSIQFNKPLAAHMCDIPGIILFDLDVHGDNRGWFKENWQSEKMRSLGLADFTPVQNNISFNTYRGVTRGFHAEPWDKFISVASGKVFGAWVDLREGDTFGKVFTYELDPSRAIFIPRGVANAFQTLEDNTVYTYLVNDYWSANKKDSYVFVNLTDPILNVQWPISLEEAELSYADEKHPLFKDVRPIPRKRILVTGAHGQLGKAIEQYAREHNLIHVDYTDIDEFDFSNPEQYSNFEWSKYNIIINAGAYTNVDGGQTQEGRSISWAANSVGPSLLAQVAREHNITLVHISSDYVFDGTKEEHSESEPFSPINVYGQTKAAGDIAVSLAPKHYILRSSWVIGQGHNFVRTMMKLSSRVADPEDSLSDVPVVDDQFGKLTFTDELTRAIFYLINFHAPYGTYNLSGSGASASWEEIARETFRITNNNGDKVRPITTAEYIAKARGPIAPRPRYSALNLQKIEDIGFSPRPWRESLAEYIEAHRSEID